MQDTKGTPGERGGGGGSRLKKPRGHLQLLALQSARRAGPGLAAAPGARCALDPRSPAGARLRRLGLGAGSGARRARTGSVGASAACNRGSPVGKPRRWGLRVGGERPAVPREQTHETCYADT